jgi:hypothetical protein
MKLSDFSVVEDAVQERERLSELIDAIALCGTMYCSVRTAVSTSRDAIEICDLVGTDWLREALTGRAKQRISRIDETLKGLGVDPNE